MELRFKILKSYIFPVLLYGCESWTIKSDSRKKFDVVEVWLLRRLFRVPYITRRTNLAVLEMAGTSRQLMTILRGRQIGYLGHTMRVRSLKRDCLLGALDGTRARGRQILKYTNGIKTLVGMQNHGRS